MTTRNGKIARLPEYLRDQLNDRLDNGETGKTLVPWLNSLPVVQELLKQDFAGKPIRPQNLSEWRKGGYADSRAGQDRLDTLRSLMTESNEMGRLMEPDQLRRQLSRLLSIELIKAAHDISADAGKPEQRQQRLGWLLAQYVQLQREEIKAERQDLVREQWQETCRQEQKTDMYGMLAKAQLYGKDVVQQIETTFNPKVMKATEELRKLEAEMGDDVPTPTKRKQTPAQNSPKQKTARRKSQSKRRTASKPVKSRTRTPRPQSKPQNSTPAPENHQPSNRHSALKQSDLIQPNPT